MAAIVIKADNMKPPTVIPGAPVRYLDAGAVAVSEYASWREVAEPTRLLARLDGDIAKRPNDPAPLNSACWTRAERAMELDRALADCTAAIALTPKASYYDSRGLVRLRLQAYADAMADYDAALASRPNTATSLFGRGLAKLRSGDKPGGEADLAEARKLDPRIDGQFAEMGIRP